MTQPSGGQDAGPERRAELHRSAEARARQAVMFIDATFSVPKSVTVVATAFERRQHEARRNAERAEASDDPGAFERAEASDDPGAFERAEASDDQAVRALAVGHSERWRPVVADRGPYEVSDHGRVRTLGRTDTRGRRRPARLMTPSPNSQGYLQVGLTPLSVDGRPCPPVFVRVHTLVLEAFVGPRPDGQEATYRTADRSDVGLANLAWGQHAPGGGRRWKVPVWDRRARRARGDVPVPVRTPGHCGRGHAVRGPNAAKRSGGNDRCLACLRGHNTVNDARRFRFDHLDIDVEADRHYALIMVEQAA